MNETNPNAARRSGGRPGSDVVVAAGLTPAQADMLAANTGLIGFMLKTRAKHLVGGVYDNADAWQDGVFGLARAVQLFDPDRGYRFSTYALPLIFQSIQRGRGRCESKRWREAYANNEARSWEPDLSLDYQPDDSSAAPIADLLPDLDAHPESDAVAAEATSRLREACRDDLDHAVLDAMLTGGRLSDVVERHGLQPRALQRRARRLRGIGARLIEQAA